jgi:hypothetical protein
MRYLFLKISTVSCTMFLLLMARAQTPSGAPKVCQECHEEETTNPSTMAITSSRATDSALLARRGELDHLDNGYRQQIKLESGRAIYTVSNGTNRFSTELDWVFGSGTMGQAFVFRRDGEWYETQVSYYSALGDLGRMLGGNAPTDLKSAIGVRLSEDKIRSCFSCHTTGARPEVALNVSILTAGIQCVQCHSGTETHVEGVSTGHFVSPTEHLSALSSEGISDRCGRCHRTWSNVIINGPHGLDNVRFQPYRLGRSKCYNATDRRISCVACHDPHHPLETSSEAYDGRCLACHSKDLSASTNVSSKICTVGTKNCVECHMPKYTLPKTKEAFTDHWIRIARPNETYPD